MKPRTTTSPFARSSWAAAPKDRERDNIDAFRARLQRRHEASNIHEPLSDARFQQESAEFSSFQQSQR